MLSFIFVIVLLLFLFVSRRFLLSVYICIVVGDSIIKRGMRSQKTDLTPPRFCVCHKQCSGFPSACLKCFCVQQYEVRLRDTLNSSCCWYWWNCWPSLRRLSFHNYLPMLSMSITCQSSSWGVLDKLYVLSNTIYQCLFCRSVCFTRYSAFSENKIISFYRTQNRCYIINISWNEWVVVAYRHANNFSAIL